MLQPISLFPLPAAGSSFCRAGLALVVALTLGSAGARPLGAQVAAPGTKPIQAPVQSTPLKAPSGPRYDNKWEVYGGLNFMNGQAGQDLQHRYNMGGGEAMATYWLTNRLGVAGDYRFGAGTTPVLSPYYNRVLAYQNIFSGGVQLRGPKNRYAAIDLHALAGGTHGTFDSAVNSYPGGSPVSACAANQQPGQRGNLGLYCNVTAPYGAVGGSVDFNYSPRVAIRISPDLTFEHFGSELREYVAVSAGVVYKFGKR